MCYCDNYQFNNMNYCACNNYWFYKVNILQYPLYQFNNMKHCAIPCVTVQYRVLLCNTVCYYVIPYVTIILPSDILTVKSDSTVDYIYLEMLCMSFSISDNNSLWGSTNIWLFRHRRTNRIFPDRTNISQQNEYSPTR